jgi:hypothetical protein
MAEILPISVTEKTHMRSIVLALALTAPLSAVASTYTNPLSARPQHPQTVMITISSRTGQEREVRVGNQQIKLRALQPTNISVPVGTTVLLYSNQDSKIQGVPLLQVAATDNGRVVEVR